MKTCKFCQHELAEDSTVCPACGKDNAEQTETAEETAAPLTEEAAAEETPAGETAAEEAAAEETPTEETAAEESTAEEAPSEEAEKQEEKKEEEKKKDSSGKIAAAVAIILVLAAILVALIIAAVKPEEKPGEPTTPADILETTAPVETVPPTVPADGNPDDATAKGTYTVTDEEIAEVRDVVVATAGEHELTNAELQIYYWMEVQAFMQQYGPYASAFGLNPAQPLDTQICPMAENGTWQQFFLSSALGTWRNYQAMASEAKAADHKLSEELQTLIDTMPEDLEKAAAENGFENAEELLKFNVGAGAGMDEYLAYEALRYEGYDYFVDVCDTFVPTEEQLEQYFTDHEEELAASGITKETYTVDVRHILISVAPEDAENEEAWKTAEARANEVLEEFLAGEHTGERFGELAAANSEDPGSQQTGGLYTGVMQGQMVPEFDAWCFDADRKPGDTGVVKTDFGYHVMFFEGRSPELVWKSQARRAVEDEMTAKFMEDTSAKYPLEVDYKKIVLAESAMFAPQN